MRLLIAMILIIPSLGYAQVDRFEELFIWKMSEALKLDAKKESEFSEAIKALNKEKAKHLEKLNEISQKMATIKNDNKAKDLVEDYERTLQAYQDVNIKEIQKLRKIFNPSTVSKYLSYKSEVLKKLQLRLKNQTKDGER